MFKSIKKIIIISAFLVGLFSVTTFVFAAAPDVGLTFGAATGLSNADPRIVAANIIRIALGFLGIIAVGLIVYGGFLWMTASGNEEQIDKAKKVLTSAIIGLVIILSAFAIASFILKGLLSATNGNGNTTTQNENGGGLPGTGGVGDPCGSVFGTCQPDICDSLTATCNLSTCLCEKNEPGSTGTSCNSSTVADVCTDNGICDSNNYCDTKPNADPKKFCTCQKLGQIGESCDSNGDPDISEVNGNMCTTGTFCDPTTYTCQAGDGEGQACGTDPAACSAGQTICSNNLICDTSSDGNSCTCQKAPIISWISPTGGFCENDQNKSCTSDGTGCTNLVCNLDAPNAAPGNIISIGGKYFGDSGKVYFQSGTGALLEGIRPSDISKGNPNCDSSWTDTQIIIIVPEGAKTGPVVIERADKKTDSTNDSRGLKIKDLLVNTIVKPGLCKISSTEGVQGDNVTYYGVNFSGSSASAKFGNYIKYIAGITSKNPVFTEKTGGAIIPGLATGETTTFISNNDGKNSNYLEFKKNAEINSGPFIADFNPKKGESGQYITISGSGFGNSKGLSKVYFHPDSGNDIEASYSFPDICLDSVWSDKQLIVKVPESIDNGNYDLVIAFADNKTISTSPGVFTVDSAAGLSPSLCKISPILGSAQTEISLWGEYFDEVSVATSRVRFSLKKDVSGFNAGSWGIDTEASAPRPDKITTKVPLGASTGQVVVIKEKFPDGGNGLDFKVGSCLDASAEANPCGTSDVCCQKGTYKEGNCVKSVADCTAQAPTSVYEFDFNTNFGLGTIFGSCLEKSKALGTCDTGTCPNSPGNCSLFPAVAGIEVTGDCNNGICDSKAGCENSSCVYSQAINKCVISSAACGLASSTKDIRGKYVQTYCASYKEDGKYVYNRGADGCPSGWINTVILVGEQKTNVCVSKNLSCDLCSANLSCSKDGNAENEAIKKGVCAVPVDICQSGSTCNSGKCEKPAAASCGCCCRKGAEFEGQDCCEGLTCAGTCGSDAGTTDTGTYGSCSGCTRATQELSDAACNCADKGTSGKFCDMAAADGKGVCGDCAALSSQSSCSSHSSSCCIDETKGGSCVNRYFGTGENDFFTLFTNVKNGLNYCGRYECVGESAFLTPYPTGESFNKATEANCGPGPEIGLSCAGVTTPANPEPKTCNANACVGSEAYSCLLGIGGPGVFNSADKESCGVCCCNPKDDKCSTVGPNKNLHCQANVGPACTGAGRGLCCGCSANTDCGKIDTAGCGSDACCRTRPEVASTMPVDGEGSVCSNAEIRATFSERMSVESFSGNVIVVGEYENNCPVGTFYLAAAEKELKDKKLATKLSNKFNYFKEKYLSWAFGRESLASNAPDTSHFYCAIAGSVASEQEVDKTTLVFRSKNLLDSGVKYFVIVRGDDTLENSSQSVRNSMNIGMNIQAGSAQRVDNASQFNGITYKGAYIWSFTVRGNVGGDKGVCAVDKASIAPASYLINTTANDINEDDSNSSKSSFDTVVDSDKVFAIQALSVDGQVLHPVSDYSWKWDWTIENKAVVDFVPNVSFVDASSNQITDVSRQLIRAVTGVTDNKTKVNAVYNPQVTPSGVVNKEIKVLADVYVFVCNNPWPPVENGIWKPWKDDSSNCAASAALGLPCGGYNYELYYCRDQGVGGPGLDLPTISGDVTRGSVGSILKESFFFREDVAKVDAIGLTAVAVPAGGAVDLSWNAILNGAQKIVSYKVYYGLASKTYTDNKIVNAPTTALRIDGLQNGKNYYFSIIAIDDLGGQSDYSAEAVSMPQDTTVPKTPSGLTVKIVGRNINVYWSGNDDDTVKYKLYYGTQPGLYGNVPQTITGTSAIITANSAEPTYYITLTALDKYNNESAKATEVSAKALE